MQVPCSWWSILSGEVKFFLDKLARFHPRERLVPSLDDLHSIGLRSLQNHTLLNERVPLDPLRLILDLKRTHIY